MQSRPMRLSLSFGLVLLALAATAATANTYNVTTSADSGPGSLRSAVAQANAHPGTDTITFDTGLGTISLTTGQIDITETLIVNGPASGQVIDASEASRIFGATVAGPALTLHNLELRRGATYHDTVTGNCSANSGQGAAVCALGTVLLTNSTITQNYALNADGGGIYVENGDLVVIRGAVTANNIFNVNPISGGGGIHVENGSVALVESSVTENRTYGPFGAGGGIFVSGGSLVMSYSTLAANGTLNDNAPGGGAHVVTGDIDILDSTISGNSTAFAATLSFGGGLSIVDGDMTLNASTVTDNHAAAGSGLYLNNGPLRHLDLTSTILSANGTENVFAVLGTINASYSLFGDLVGKINGTNLNNVLSNVPDLVALNDNGCANPAGKPGLASAHCPRSHLPNMTSPAIGAGDNPWGYPTDQRSTGFVRTYGPQTDIGAIENGPGLLQFALPVFSVSEAGPTATITVSRTQGTAGSVSAGYATSNGTATAGSDYTAASGTVTWGNGDGATKSFTVSIIDDLVWEPSETVNLTLSNPLSNPGGGAALGNQRSAVLTINDDDSGPGQLQFSAATYSIAEHLGLVTITVQRVGGSNGVVRVDYATSNGSATAGSDYTAASGTLTWSNGDTANKTFNVLITDDGVLESDETINLTLSNPQYGATLGSPGTAVLTILDNDGPGRLEFSAPTYTVSENVGEALIIVNRVGGSGGAISVQFDTGNGTATAGADYTAISLPLFWADGAAGPLFVFVPILPDALVETAETVNLALSSPTGGATLGNQSAATLVITNGIPSTAGQLRFSSPTYAVAETAGTATITVSRVGGSTGAISVDYATVAGGTATAGTDYQGSGSTLFWADGDVADKTFNVFIFDDMAVEGNETVNLQLSNPLGGATLGSPSAATLTILDNETLSPGQLQFSAASYAVGEGGGSVTITVARVGGTDGNASVHYATSNGTASAGSDYTATSGTLNWGSGDGAAKTFTVAILEDGAVEGNETINLTLSAPTGGTLGNPSAATVTIIDNDNLSPGALRFSKTLYLVGEGGGSATITVSRVGGAAGAVAVDYTTGGGTATAGSDYTTSVGTLNWADGDAADKTFTVTILEDAAVEGLEWTFLALGNPAGGATLRSPRNAVLAITDNEAAGSVQGVPPTVAKAFGSAAMPLLGRTTLTFQVSNPNAATALSGIGFSDVFPAGLVVAAPNGLTGTCGGGTIVANPGSDTVILGGAALAASTNCVFSVDVVGIGLGIKQNTTAAITSANGGTGVPSNTATLAVVATLDIDRSVTATRYDALTDGLLILRYLTGLSGAALTTGALGGTAARTDPALVKVYLDGIYPALNIDGNGTIDAIGDGLLILRYLFGLRGDALIAGAVDPLGSRPTAAAVEAYIASLMP